MCFLVASSSYPLDFLFFRFELRGLNKIRFSQKNICVESANGSCTDTVFHSFFIEMSDEDIQDKIHYSDKYDDKDYEYRHVILPQELAKLVPRNHLMTETEWRNLGVQQSVGWVHYCMHAPEPHVLLFRLDKDFAIHV